MTDRHYTYTALGAAPDGSHQYTIYVNLARNGKKPSIEIHQKYYAKDIKGSFSAQKEHITRHTKNLDTDEKAFEEAEQKLANLKKGHIFKPTKDWNTLR